MSQKKIVFKITPSGEIKSEAFGFKGKGCLESTEKLLSGLGKTKKTEKKDEYYMHDEAHVDITHG